MEIEKAFNIIIVVITVVYTAFMFKFLFNMEEQYGANGQVVPFVNDEVTNDNTAYREIYLRAKIDKSA